MPDIQYKKSSLDPASFGAVLGRMLETSTLTSGFIAVLLVVGILYCVISGMVVPDFLSISLGTIIGFFFGSRGQDAINRNAKVLREYQL